MTRKSRGRKHKRLVLGDVIEIPLSKRRFAYAQFVFYYRDPPGWGHLVRVLPGVFTKRPESFADLVKEQELFSTFFMAAPAVNNGDVTIVGNEEIPERCRQLPLFKDYNENYETGIKTWFLWDGKETRMIGRLPTEYYDLPDRILMSLKGLVDRIKAGWRPRDEVADALTNVTAITRDRV
jgi:hypothetical protein